MSKKNNTYFLEDQRSVSHIDASCSSKGLKDYSSASKLSLRMAPSTFRQSGDEYNTQSGQKSKQTYNKINISDLLSSETTDSPSTHLNRKPGEVQGVICDKKNCGKKFATFESMKLHQKRKHAAPTSFICELCQASFSSPPNLEKHVIGVHAKHKPFQCISCSSSFSFKDGLEQHINMVHKDIRPFPCSHCLAQFKSKSSLHKHLLRSHARFGEKQEK